MKKLNVGIVGYKFMGKAHSNGWLQASRFFDLPAKPVLKVACGRDAKQLAEFAERWGWEHTETDWKKMVHRDDVDIVDISAPDHMHHEIALEAARAGKHIFCEKPLAMTSAQAREMYELAEKKGITHYVNHNYRRLPAIRLARRLIDEGRVGQIYHWRGSYLQDWIMDPGFPLVWRLQKKYAGSGPQGDLNSHSVDLARYLVGDIRRVAGMTGHFIKERPLADEVASGTLSGKAKGVDKGAVTVEDAAFMLVEFANGALGSFEASRFAGGRKNHSTFEIYGSKGSILFDMERMNELEFFSREDPAHAQGFRTIIATEGGQHDYVANWWPPGHIIGYEHSFVHAMVDFVKAVDSQGKIEPSFYDGMKEIEVLEAGLKAAETGRTVELS
jgi:predicted dehydrogenase